ncbi:MAG: hypothetical protein QOH64_219 [Acidimicrobiaceae bacterium]
MTEPGINALHQDTLPKYRDGTGSTLALVASGLAAVVGLVIFIAVLKANLDQPTFVAQVGIENTSDYDIQVSVSDGHGSRWVALGVAAQHCTTTFEQVVDQGGTWSLRFQAQGVDAGGTSATRGSLEDSHWTLTIPPEVAERLAQLGVAHPPRRDCATATSS